MIHTFGPQCLGVLIAATASTAPASVAWPTANQAFFYPFVINEPFLAQQIGHMNGGTANGNMDVGIYDTQGNRLVSIGSTAQSGTSAEQLFNITDTLLDRGLYYLAIAMDGTTGTSVRASGPSGVGARSTGIWLMSTAFPLPAMATYAALGATIPVPSAFVIGESI